MSRNMACAFIEQRASPQRAVMRVQHKAKVAANPCQLLPFGRPLTLAAHSAAF
jgi:hypothetical protein